jgi:hypothetical protein
MITISHLTTNIAKPASEQGSRYVFGGSRG